MFTGSGRVPNQSGRAYGLAAVVVVAGADGGDELHGDVLCDQGLQKDTPQPPRGGRILIGQIDKADAGLELPHNSAGHSSKYAQSQPCCVSQFTRGLARNHAITHTILPGCQTG